MTAPKVAVAERVGAVPVSPRPMRDEQEPEGISPARRKEKGLPVLTPEQEAKLRYALGEMSENRKFAVLAKWGGYVTLMRKRKQALRRALEVAMEAEVLPILNRSANPLRPRNCCRRDHSRHPHHPTYPGAQ